MSPTKSKPPQTTKTDETGEELGRAMTRAGMYLARRAHSRHELAIKLARFFDEQVVAVALDRLERLGLTDDAAMAAQWVEERAHKRGRDALVEELRAKGVGDLDIEAALGHLDVNSQEEARAVALAERLYAKVASKPLARQGRSLAAMLARRGFSFEAAEAATRAVLPPEGWD
ncbi:MAG: recombination regulator RecX [Actinobacteria bacterium]|nr:recombination regulator RecX [Actinomycetota bacterium]